MAMEIFRLIGSVFVDTAEAEKSLQKTDKDAEGIGSRLLDVGKKAGAFAVSMGTAMAAAGTALVAVAENTREYRTEQGKLEAAFSAAGFSADAAYNSYRGLVNVLGDSGQAVEAANHLAQLATNEKDLYSWTTICTGVYATFGDSLPIEGLTEAANETAKVGATTGSLADALNWVSLGSAGWQEALGSNSAALAAFRAESSAGSDNATAFTAALQACSTEAERQALITSTLNVAYSDAADKYREVNGEVISANSAQESFNATMAEVGAAVEPFITEGKLLLAEVLANLTPTLTSLGETILPLLTDTVTTVASIAIPLFTDAVEWVSANVLPLITTALTTLSEWFGTIQTNLTDSGITFDTVMNAIQTLFSGVMTVMQTVWTTIGQPVWDLIMQIVGSAYALFQEHMPAIQGFVSTAFTDIQTLWETGLKPALEAIGAFINDILAPAFQFVFETVIGPVVETAFSTISSLWTDSLQPALQSILDFVNDVFSGDFTGAFSSMSDAVSSIWNGLETIIKSPLNAVIGVLNSFLGKINRLEIPAWVPGIGGKGLDIPLIPTLERGGVLEKGQVGFLEGNGAEAVVPLHQNKAWISKVAQDMDVALGGNASSGQMISLLSAMLTKLEAIAEMGVYLDTDQLVGGIARKMDRRLGQLQAQKARA